MPECARGIVGSGHHPFQQLVANVPQPHPYRLSGFVQEERRHIPPEFAASSPCGWEAYLYKFYFEGTPKDRNQVVLKSSGSGDRAGQSGSGVLSASMNRSTRITRLSNMCRNLRLTQLVPCTGCPS